VTPLVRLSAEGCCEEHRQLAGNERRYAQNLKLVLRKAREIGIVGSVIDLSVDPTHPGLLGDSVDTIREGFFRPTSAMTESSRDVGFRCREGAGGPGPDGQHELGAYRRENGIAPEVLLRGASVAAKIEEAGSSLNEVVGGSSHS
jgi:hypothetical protein